MNGPERNAKITALVATLDQHTADRSHYRVSFFFGPEPDGDDGSILRCVFNVKKRSWKGGVQVSVEIGREQRNRLRKALEFQRNCEQAFRAVPPDEHREYRERAEDLLTQELCHRKLELSLQRGLEPENQCIPIGAFETELEHVVVSEPDHIVTRVLQELDLSPELDASQHT